MYNSAPTLPTKQEEWERGYCAQVLRGALMESLGHNVIDYVDIPKLEHDKRRASTVFKHLRDQGYLTNGVSPNVDMIKKIAHKWEAAPKFKNKAIEYIPGKGTVALKDVKELYEPIRSSNDAEVIYLYYHQDTLDIKYMELERTRRSLHGRSGYMQGAGYLEKYQEWRAYPKESLSAADTLLYEGQIEAWVEKNLPRAIKELTGLPIKGESSLGKENMTPDKMSWQVSYHLGQAQKHLRAMQELRKIRKYVRSIAKEVPGRIMSIP